MYGNIGINDYSLKLLIFFIRDNTIIFIILYVRKEKKKTREKRLDMGELHIPYHQVKRSPVDKIRVLRCTFLY